MGQAVGLVNVPHGAVGPDPEPIVNVAVTLLSPFKPIRQEPVPVQAPLQPVNVEPSLTFTVSVSSSVICRLQVKVPENGQVMLPLTETVPRPEPALLTVRLQRTVV